MVGKDGIFGSPDKGYDVYRDGRYLGWNKLKKDAREIYQAELNAEKAKSAQPEKKVENRDMGLKNKLSSISNFIPGLGIINKMRAAKEKAGAVKEGAKSKYAAAAAWKASNPKKVAGGIGVIVIIIFFILFSTLVAALQFGFENLEIILVIK